jgi:hypothetical protein
MNVSGFATNSGSAPYFFATKVSGICDGPSASDS